MLHCRLRGKNQTEHVDVEYLVELLLGDALNRTELVHPRVVDEDVEAAVVLDGRSDDTLGLRRLRNVTTHGDGLATGCGDGGDNLVRAGLAGSVIYDYGCPFGGECFGDGGSDAFGRACHYCYLTFKFAHG